MSAQKPQAETIEKLGEGDYIRGAFSVKKVLKISDDLSDTEGRHAKIKYVDWKFNRDPPEEPHIVHEIHIKNYLTDPDESFEKISEDKAMNLIEGM